MVVVSRKGRRESIALRTGRGLRILSGLLRKTIIPLFLAKTQRTRKAPREGMATWTWRILGGLYLYTKVFW